VKIELPLPRSQGSFHIPVTKKISAAGVLGIFAKIPASPGKNS